MKVIISGASGMIGSALAFALREAGHTVQRLMRSYDGMAADDVYWNPATGELKTDALEKFDAVVHLSGESISAGRWNTDKKERIFSSRVEGTQTLAKALAKLPAAGKTFICASAIGYYGNRGSDLLDEASPRGRGDFLSDVCAAWEEATQPASQAGVRTVMTRLGIVLSDQGGTLKQMLTPYKLGLGGKIGNGQQYMSWITLDDVVGGILFALNNPALQGPANFVAPNPVTNYEFTKTLGWVLSRPTIVPMPGFLARAAFGQMADELLLSSQRVRPAKLEAAGYAFKYPSLTAALMHVLGKAPKATPPKVNPRFIPSATPASADAAAEASSAPAATKSNSQ